MLVPILAIAVIIISVIIIVAKTPNEMEYLHRLTDKMEKGNKDEI